MLSTIKKKFLKELGKASSDNLRNGIQHCKRWNQSSSGILRRKRALELQIQEVTYKKKILEDGILTITYYTSSLVLLRKYINLTILELEDYMFMIRQIELAKEEKRKAEAKAKIVESECAEKEAKLRDEIAEITLRIEKMSLNKDELALDGTLREDLRK